MKRKVKKQSPVMIAFMLLTVLFIFVMSAFNVPLLRKPLEDFCAGRSDFATLVTQIQKQYVEHFSAKYPFVHLNGWFANCLDQLYDNKIVKLKNGMLMGDPIYQLDVEPQVQSTAEFKDYLDALDIPFLFVMAPFKIDPEGQLLPVGFENYGNVNADTFLAGLRDNGIDSLDLRQTLSSTLELIDRYYLRTDNHWNFTGAFIGCQELCRKLQELFPERTFDLSYANFDQWEEHELKNWFIGSYGRRVGMYYGGLDDLVYYTPKFATNLSRTIPLEQEFRKGDFIEATTDPNRIEHRPELMGITGYGYYGTRHALTQYRNPTAPNDLRILIMGDSFVLPLRAYLSTMFQEVDTYDPRDTDQFSFADYVEWYKPDVVIKMLVPGSLSNKIHFNYGTEDAIARLALSPQPVLEKQDVVVAEGDERGNFQQLPVRLERGKTYLLEFDGVRFTSGSAEGTTVLLYDPASKKILNSAIFDIAYCDAHDGFKWYFNVKKNAEKDLQLLLYAGLPAERAGIDMTYLGVRLSVLS